MAQRPGIPKGTRDFSPEEMQKRNYIFSALKEIFELYGFEPLETPAMENLSTLTGKYGEEGDRLLFKILNSGDFLGKVQEPEKETSSSMVRKIAEKGLRYDLTVPFARYVVQKQHELNFPFKRYQIQPVWRADRPQKGRYREFYQCDADVIGMDSPFSEAELIKMIDEVFQKLGMEVRIKINSRKILYGIAEATGAAEHFNTITVAMDKLDKTGIEQVAGEMKANYVPEEIIDKLKPVLMFRGSFQEKIRFLKDLVVRSQTGMQGVEELERIIEKTELLAVQPEVELDLTLARGLDYYTGAIIEVVASDARMGSICGGGRYDDLTGVFGLKGVSGVGISFGAERIYDVMEELDLFPRNIGQSVKVMLVNFGEEEEKECVKILRKLREQRIPSEMFPKPAKMKKQMNFANAKNIPWVILMGKEEIEQQKVSLKNMHTGEQKRLSVEAAIREIID